MDFSTNKILADFFFIWSQTTSQPLLHSWLFEIRGSLTVSVSISIHFFMPVLCHFVLGQNNLIPNKNRQWYFYDNLTNSCVGEVSALGCRSSGSASRRVALRCVVLWLSPPRSINGNRRLGVTCDRLASHPGGVEIHLVSSSFVALPDADLNFEKQKHGNVCIRAKRLISPEFIPVSVLSFYPPPSPR